jgi:predicted phosphodiesterase
LDIVVPQVLRFVEAGYKVHNHFVRGNHGRVSKFHHEVTNWDYIYGLTMQTMLKNVPNMTFNVTPNWHQVVNVQGNRILQWHGHQIKMHLNLPWYSLTARISRWAICEDLEDFDISVSGHFHSSSLLNWNEKKLFTNGTMVSGDQFALEFIGLAASECQHLFGVNKKGITWRYEVSFESE